MYSVTALQHHFTMQNSPRLEYNNSPRLEYNNSPKSAVYNYNYTVYRATLGLNKIRQAKKLLLNSKSVPRHELEHKV